MAKGGDFEREVSRLLSLWWTEGARDDVFWRTSASGGRATSRAQAFKRTRYEYGDITFTDPIGKPLLDVTVIEAKRGYTNTSRRIKQADMMKVCSMAAKAGDPSKIKTAVQNLFSKAKKQDGIDLLGIIDSKVARDRQTLVSWVRKGEIDRAQAGVPYFLLIGRRDNHNPFVLTPLGMQRDFETWNGIPSSSHYVIFNMDGQRYFMTPAESYFEWLTPETIHAIAEKNVTRRFVP